MSIEQDITYTFAWNNSTLARTRVILSAVAGALDTQIPAGAANVPSSFALSIAKALSIFATCDQAVALASGGTSAMQTVSISGTPTGGTFTLTLLTHTTAGIAYDAAASAVATALQALTGVGPSGVSCTGGPLPGTPVVCTFAGPLAIQAVATMTASSSGLTGGSTPTASAADTLTGVAPDTVINLGAGVPLVWDAIGYFAQPFAADVTTLSVTNAGTVPANFKLRTLANS